MKNVPYKKSLVSDIFTTAVEMSLRLVSFCFIWKEHYLAESSYWIFQTILHQSIVVDILNVSPQVRALTTQSIKHCNPLTPTPPKTETMKHQQSGKSVGASPQWSPVPAKLYNWATTSSKRSWKTRKCSFFSWRAVRIWWHRKAKKSKTSNIINNEFYFLILNQ